jgi:hypothetical protein
MDAADKNGDHFNIELQSERAVLTYRTMGPVLTVSEPTADIRPNPNSGQFELIVKFPTNYWMEGFVYDYAGRKIMSLGKFQTDEITTQIVRAVNATQLAQGKYLLVMVNENKRITKPFVKI